MATRSRNDSSQRSSCGLNSRTKAIMAARSIARATAALARRRQFSRQPGKGALFVALMLSVPGIAGGDLALSIALGVGLAAAVGFRVFLPLLVMSIAAYFGHLHLSSGFAWLGSMPALLMLTVAAVLEIIAY